MLRKFEDMNRGKPNWEHLDEELHVLVSVEDYENRAAVKLRRATETIRNFLEQGVRTPENEDRLKQLQLMELAVLNDKDRQQAQAHQAQQQQQQQQQQQLLLQHQSLLSNPAAAAAAAAQLLHTSSSAQTTSQLLARLQASPIGISSLNAAALQLNPAIAAGITGSTAALQAAAAAAAAGGSGATLPFSAMTSLASYLSSPGLTASPIQAGSASSFGTTTGGSAIGLPLSQLPCTTAAGLGFSTLPFSVNPGLSTSGSTNLINCTPGSAQDQYTALAAALLSGGTNNTTTNNTAAAQMSNGKVSVSAGSSKPSTSYYPMTSLASSLVDPVTIIEYNSANSVAAAQEMASDSLKLRSISSGQNRMHPYLR
ncbi:hypothetical protein CRM22_011127 [Opisthorchis felineus]|uniref:Uncharacterized protein n=1 Tax=Opisthorchis felineus TaxID=147828 RepID=A0A4S2KAE9_OPIFE|nr:hypothetical protein CRM22_011127 [Opisthorchis felineus]